MIRALVLWFAKRALGKYLSPALATRIVEAASAAFDEIKAKGEEAVMADGKGVASAPFVILPLDPAARPVTEDDRLKSENNPAG